MSKLTPTQRRVYDFLIETIEGTGSAPTLREICERFGFNSVHSAKRNVDSLLAHGLVTKNPRKARGISICRHISPDGDPLPITPRMCRDAGPGEAIRRVNHFLSIPWTDHEREVGRLLRDVPDFWHNVVAHYTQAGWSVQAISHTGLRFIPPKQIESE